MTKKKFELLTKREALILAWKKRKDYIGPDTKSSLYASWRARVFTKKGQLAGFPIEWETFKGFKTNMSQGWFEKNIISQPCSYCGDTENVGCDRIDNKKGHTIDNIIPACYTCNIVRSHLFTVEEMKKLGKVITQIKEDRKKLC